MLHTGLNGVVGLVIKRAGVGMADGTTFPGVDKGRRDVVNHCCKSSRALCSVCVDAFCVDAFYLYELNMSAI